jgi:hypothetical protein
MSNSDYSRLLTKMAELKELEVQYKEITGNYRPATARQEKETYNQLDDKNAMSNTATPLVTRPGNDHQKVWKYVGKIQPDASNTKNGNSLKCWNLAANDTRLFKKVVYTGDAEFGSNPGQQEWNNRCYGLIYDASENGFDTTTSTGYTTMTGKTGNPATNIYTKLGIANDKDLENIAGAAKVNEIQGRVNSLIREIVEVSEAGINSDLNDLVKASTESNELVSNIHKYMNNGALETEEYNRLVKKRKNISSTYSEVNEQRTLFARKYRFIFYVFIAIFIIGGYAFYTSNIPAIDILMRLKEFFQTGWWTRWWVITIVVIIFILSSFGWDMKGNIMMVFRYISDPEFWTGQMWWLGVSFLLLLIVFFHATFKSFFLEFDASMKEVQDGLDNDS